MAKEPSKKPIPVSPAVDDEDPTDIPMRRKPTRPESELTEQIREDNERIQKGAP
jgi:hypothetical protein